MALRRVSYLDNFSMHSSNFLSIFLCLRGMCLKHALQLRDALGEMLFDLDFHLLIRRGPASCQFAYEQDVCVS